MLLPELIYYLGYRLKRNRDFKKQKTLPRPVISVGNLTVGGTGKTPAVMRLAEEAMGRGFFPVILTRGYKGRINKPCFVGKGDGPLLSPEEAGDEAFLMAKRLKGVPVIKSADRYEGGCLALETFRDAERMIFILDDGYQHFRLFRDVDILLIDGMNPFGNRRLLPVGRLREPLEAIRRADIIVTTGSPTIPEPLLREIRNYNDGPVFSSRHRPSFFCTLNGRTIPLKELSGKSVIAFCGIGNPESFKRSIIETGAGLRDIVVFRDHHRFTSHDLKRIERIARRYGADWIITTEKDIIKIHLSHITDRSLQDSLCYLSIDFEVERNFFEEVFRRL